MPTGPVPDAPGKLTMTSIKTIKAYPIYFSAMLLGCATGADVVKIGDDAWRLTTIDYNATESARVATAQANEFCGKQGRVPFVSMMQTQNDMPARYISTMEFQCTAGGTSPEALAEARMRGYQRNCAIAGFALGSPENLKCAMDISAKANPKPGTGR